MRSQAQRKNRRENNQFLVRASIHHEPYRLLAFRGIAFLGCKPGEKGFIVGTKAGNIPPCVAEKHFLRHPDQIVAMRPFMGGQELNNNEHATPSRHAIFLDEHTSSIFKETSDLLKSFLTTSKRSSRHWYRYSAPANELMSRLATMENIIALAETSNAFIFEHVPSQTISSNTVWCFTDTTPGMISLLQSAIHEEWTRLLTSTLKDDLRYVASECIETLPVGRDALSTELCKAEQVYLIKRHELT